jgi:hypothetical protein
MLPLSASIGVARYSTVVTGASLSNAAMFKDALSRTVSMTNSNQTRDAAARCLAPIRIRKRQSALVQKIELAHFKFEFLLEDRTTPLALLVRSRDDIHRQVANLIDPHDLDEEMATPIRLAVETQLGRLQEVQWDLTVEDRTPEDYETTQDAVATDTLPNAAPQAVAEDWSSTLDSPSGASLASFNATQGVLRLSCSQTASAPG